MMSTCFGRPNSVFSTNKLDSFRKILHGFRSFRSRSLLTHGKTVSPLFMQDSEFCTPQRNTVQLSPQDVNLILRANEFNKEFHGGSVKAYDSNQLPSNDPIEDTRSEAQCNLTTGLLIGVFDGHGGAACAQVIAKRLFKYVAACLLPVETLEKCFSKSTDNIIHNFYDKLDLVDDIKQLYQQSFHDFLSKLMQVDTRKGFDMGFALKRAFTQLDSDLSQEVLKSYDTTGNVNLKTLSVAMSGAVACVAHIDGPHLHVANVGDCNAVVGYLSENNEWIANKITKEHNSDNYDELRRIWNEHPDTEKSTVIRRNRLLGELAPLRSLGDFRYKWSGSILSKVVVPITGDSGIPQNYHTPPYLTAEPEVFYHRLTPRDKFLVIASDGLWDMMTPLQAIKLVGEHMMGKVFFNPLKLPRKNLQLGDINELLLQRKESLKSKPKDRNAATHLLRHAIGGTEYGIDHSKLSHLLSLPAEVCRMFRDDITITVVYFDSEYLRNCPA